MSGAHVMAIAGTQALASGGSSFPNPGRRDAGDLGPRLRGCRGDRPCPPVRVQLTDGSQFAAFRIPVTREMRKIIMR
jgi:hypothetical protein